MGITAYVLFFLAGIGFGYAAPTRWKWLPILFPIALALLAVFIHGFDGAVLIRLIIALIVTAARRVRRNDDRRSGRGARGSAARLTRRLPAQWPQSRASTAPSIVEELGLTLIHEHFRATDEAARFQFPHLYDEQAEWDAALSDANAVKGHGVQDGRRAQRDVSSTATRAFSKRVADESGLQVILATGVYTYDHLPQVAHEPHRGRDRRDLRPRHRERHPGHRHQGRLHQVRGGRAGRDAQRREDPPRGGASVESDRPADSWPTRTPKSGTGLEQMRVFEDEGVDPAKVQVAHTGDTDDLDYIERLLDTGCWIGMDRYGLDIYLPTEQRQATVLSLLEKGHADRMFLSQDWCSTLDYFTRSGRGAVGANRRAELVDDIPLRAGHPRAQGARNDRGAARPDDGREPQALASLSRSAGVV